MLIRLLNNQSINVFQIFHHASVEVYEIFTTQLVSGHSAERSTVSEHKKLTMLAVCNLIHVVQTTPHIFYLLVHSISNGFWSAFCYLRRIVSTNIFTVFGVGM